MKRLWMLAFTLIATGAYAQAFGQIALRQSDAVEILIGPIVDSADATVETGLTISQGDVLLIKCAAAGDCGASAQKNESTACSHVAGGVYECDLDATDTGTVGILRVNVQESGTAPWWQDFVVVEEAVYDASMAGSAAPLSASAVWTNGTRTLTALDEDDTTIDLNGTTIGTVSTATAVTTVNGIANNAITAAAIATGAIDADAIAADAIGASEIAADAIGASELAANAIGSSEVADGAIDAGAIANAAIDAATFASDVDAEILSYIVDDSTRLDASELNTVLDRIGTPSDLGGGTATLAGNLADIEGQTDDIGAAGAGLTEAGGTGDQLTAIPSVPVAKYTNADGDECTFVISESEPHLDVSCTEAE